MEKFSLAKELTIISKIHGKVFDAKTSYGDVKIIPLYHSAVALYQNSLKGEMFKDFEVIKKFIA